jgi:hypothetical protein
MPVPVPHIILPVVHCYPNPVTDLLTIETGISDRYDIDITNLNGQLVFRKNIEKPTHKINLSSFQKGVYFITIRSKDFVTTSKIIKM